MAVSDYDFIYTRNDIIRAAYKKVLAFDDEDTLTGNQINDAVKYLNMIIAEWEKGRYKLFQRYEYELTTAASDADYAVPTDPPCMGILQASFVDSTRDVPLKVISFPDYLEITYKALSGKPLEIAYDPVGGLFYVYPTPEGAYTINLLLAQKVKDFDSSGSISGIVPEEAQRALIYSLALELSFDYGLTLDERNSIEKQKNVALKEWRKGDFDIVDERRSRGYA